MSIEKSKPSESDSIFQHPQGSPVEEINYILTKEDEQIHLWEIQAITDWPLPNPLTDSLDPEKRAYKLKSQVRNKEPHMPKKFPEGNPEALREEFGPSKLGETAYQLIRNGAECETYMDEDKNKCGSLSIGTVDVDSSTRHDIFPYCSEEHARMLTDQLEFGIKNDGRNTYPSRNGFGRHSK